MHPEIHVHRKDFFSVYIRPAHVTQRIQELRFYLKEELYKFAHKFKLELLIVENALTIPLNLPLGWPLPNSSPKRVTLSSHIITISTGNVSAS